MRYEEWFHSDKRDTSALLVDRLGKEAVYYDRFFRVFVLTYERKIIPIEHFTDFARSYR